jgi:hypothetical protein
MLFHPFAKMQPTCARDETRLRLRGVATHWKLSRRGTGDFYDDSQWMFAPNVLLMTTPNEKKHRNCLGRCCVVVIHPSIPYARNQLYSNGGTKCHHTHQELSHNLYTERRSKTKLLLKKEVSPNANRFR